MSREKDVDFIREWQAEIDPPSTELSRDIQHDDLRSATILVVRALCPAGELSDSMLRTPERMAKALIELTTPVPFEFTTFVEEGTGGMVVQRNIPVYSLCEHHILPFFGKAHIAYIPGLQPEKRYKPRGPKDTLTFADEVMNRADESKGMYRIAGLSKLARTVQFYMRRLQVQERLTAQIANRIEEELKPQGVAVILECEHFCQTMRGASTPGTTTTTNDLRGAFMDNAETRAELFALLDRK